MLFTLAERGILQAQLFDLSARAFSFVDNRSRDENGRGVDRKEQAEIVYGKGACPMQLAPQRGCKDSLCGDRQGGHSHPPQERECQGGEERQISDIEAVAGLEGHRHPQSDGPHSRFNCQLENIPAGQRLWRIALSAHATPFGQLA